MKNEMYQSMYETDSYHWWFRGKREIVDALAQDALSQKNDTEKTIIDFGCGCGLMLEALQKYGNVTGADFSEQALKYCQNRFAGKLRKIDLSISSTMNEKYDFAVALDILEHIDNDEIAAQNLYASMKSGGKCIVTVPAFQWLWTAHDNNCMHKRRYNKAALERLLTTSGFTVDFVSYYNFFLSPAIIVVRLFTKILGLDKNSSLENKFSDNFVNKLLYRIFITEKKFILKRKHFPFGVSLIAIISKPNTVI